MTSTELVANPLHRPFSLFQWGAPNTKLLIIGEAPGEDEERTGVPFVGASGKLLDNLLALAGLSRNQFNVTNVFTERPPGNDLKTHWTSTKTELKKAGYSMAARLPPLNKRYLLPEHEHHIARLHAEIDQLNPTFILMLGATALWAVTGESRIGQNRGTILALPGGRTGLATFHPAMVLRQWDQRPLVWADLSKAAKHLAGTLTPPIMREFCIDPTFDEIEHVYDRFWNNPQWDLGVDIETDPRIGQITTISFCTPALGICIPFYNKATLPEMCNYWHTAAEEAKAWRWVQRFGALPNKKVGQNFLYDHQYLLEDLDLRIHNLCDDTSILQHCLQPELPKALAVLASLYINEPAWKFMRESSKDDNKADE
jgi:uracil-DNA glycosylase